MESEAVSSEEFRDRMTSVADFQISMIIMEWWNRPDAFICNASADICMQVYFRM